MQRNSLKCIPLLLQVASIAHGLDFHNPPTTVDDPQGYKIIEKNNNIIFELLGNKDTRDLLRKLKTEEVKTSVSNAMEKHEDYIDEVHSSKIVKDRHRNYVKNNKHRSKKLGGHKRVLVKRPVPHGYKSETLEYDSRYKTFFKPLMRVHVKRGIGNGDRLFHYSDKKKRFIKFHDRDLLKPLFLFDIEEGNSNGYPQEESVEKDDIAVITRDINDVLQNISPKRHKMSVLDLLEGLRTNDISEGSSEESADSDSGATRPVELDPQLVPDEMTLPAPNKPFHHMFQHWTYQKNIHEDDCTGDTVKVGNVCSWTPPH